MQSAQEMAVRIEALAKERSISINQLLSDCNLASGAFANVKIRGSMPSADKLFRIAQYLGVTMEFLLTGEDRPQNRGGEFVYFSQLEKACLAKGISVTAATVALGYSKGSMSYWKRGNVPSGDIVARFAEYLGVTTDFLLMDPERRQTIEEVDSVINERPRSAPTLKKSIITSLAISSDQPLEAKNDTVYIFTAGCKIIGTLQRPAKEDCHWLSDFVEDQTIRYRQGYGTESGNDGYVIVRNAKVFFSNNPTEEPESFYELVVFIDQIAAIFGGIR